MAKLTIKVVTQAPAPTPDQLTALLDGGAGRALCAPATVAAHPAAADLSRRQKQEKDGLQGAYLATGAAPLLYLPVQLAKAFDPFDQLRILGAKAYDAASERKAAQLVLALDGADGAEFAALVAEGIALRAYRFTRYKAGNGDGKGPEVLLLVAAKEAAAVRKAVAEKLDIVESVNAARDLINEPGSVATPAFIEAAARAVARKNKLKITVLQAAELKKLGYNGLLSVGRGGDVPPRMIVLSYTPAGTGRGKKGTGRHLGLLGKGITFDTGGISIKPAGKMWEMKTDMSGAAAVLYAIDAIARQKVPQRVTAIIVTAQNYVDQNSIVPGDIFKAANGKTVHVDNTDAEGRLILSDGLHRMGQEGVTDLVDVATLTGACVRALGPALTGAFGADELLGRVLASAAAQGEPCWQLPLVEEYAEWLKFEIADVNNITGKVDAGATTAALFLREFVPPGVNWVHLDIAGTALADNHRKYYRPGATGIMVRTFVDLAKNL